MAQIPPILDEYIDEVIKSSGDYVATKNKTQGIKLRELIKKLRDYFEQEIPKKTSDLINDSDFVVQDFLKELPEEGNSKRPFIIRPLVNFDPEQVFGTNGQPVHMMLIATEEVNGKIVPIQMKIADGVTPFKDLKNLIHQPDQSVSKEGDNMTGSLILTQYDPLPNAYGTITLDIRDAFNPQIQVTNGDGYFTRVAYQSIEFGVSSWDGLADDYISAKIIPAYGSRDIYAELPDESGKLALTSQIPNISGKLDKITTSTAKTQLYAKKADGSQEMLDVDALGLTETDTSIPTSKLVKIKLDEVLNQKGQALGLATLDNAGKVPVSQLPDAILGALQFQSQWNASTNTPAIPAVSAQNKGHFYITQTAGVYNSISYNVGDWILSNGTAWEKISNSDTVISVFGRIGNVVAVAGDYTSDQILNQSSISGNYITDALEQLNNSKAADANVVHKTGDEYINGNKVFESFQVEAVKITNTTFQPGDGDPDDTYDQKLQRKNGTIALLADIPNLSRYADLYANNVFSGTAAFNANVYTYYLYSKNGYGITDTAGAMAFRIATEASNGSTLFRTVRSNGDFITSFTVNRDSANITFTSIPNVNGDLLAVKSDIPGPIDISGKANLAGDNTFTGDSNTFPSITTNMLSVLDDIYGSYIEGQNLSVSGGNVDIADANVLNFSRPIKKVNYATNNFHYDVDGKIDHTILIDGSGNAGTMTLPDARNIKGRIFILKAIGTASVLVSVDGVGGQFEDNGTIIVGPTTSSGVYKCVTVQAAGDGSNMYYIIGQF
ncbi:autotransporter outer membrane beta-barrel domain-containing protein [Pedobacter montanisoli]|uniref:Tail fiber protein n=1 Tax=Pedobacter montanisoli TaxID=2923277 RepID=A0ABS9ZXR6_9SPHI|nr:hypothetical protein [Pedobacter montanisoli]MCJ0743121.1 hypothetical protein [Pedobacter montanisoli]